MLNEVYRLLEEVVRGEEIKAFASDYQQYPLKLSFRSYAQGIAHLKDCYEKLGLQAEILLGCRRLRGIAQRVGDINFPCGLVLGRKLLVVILIRGEPVGRDGSAFFCFGIRSA